jgi:Bacterial Ig-like domain/WD40-like Beta Propeller Repeat
MAFREGTGMSKVPARASMWRLAVCLPIVWACSKDSPEAPVVGPKTPPTPNPVIASPIVVSSSHPGTVPWLSGAAPSGVVWIAAPAGSLPNGFFITLRSRAANTTATVYLQDGGFDPLPFPAGSGDTLFADLENCFPAGNCLPTTYAFGVPATSRPSVLRTFPSLHARDVELSAKVIVFFSEPITVGSLSASGVRLSMNGVVVPAGLAFADTQHLAIALAPTAPLSPSTSYSIGFTDALQNVDGQSLATPPVVDFTVGTSTSGPPPGQLAFSSLAPNSALQIFLMNADGTNVRQLTNSTDDASSEPAWSPDGTKIAFTKARVINNEISSRIAVMNADGSNVVELATGVVGPSGTYTTSEGFTLTLSRIGVMNADGSGTVWLTSSGSSVVSDADPAWAPDGTRIAFSRSTLIDAENETWNSEITIVSASGSAPRPLTFGDGPLCWQAMPDWMPDGAGLLFWDSCASGFGTGSIVVGDASGTGALRSISSSVPASVFSMPRISPDGNWIGVNMFVQFNPATAWPMYVMRADGSAPRRVGFGSGMAWRPRQ